MNIIEQAGDALKRLDKSGRAGVFHAAADIHEMGPEAVSAVVRAAKLADELDREATAGTAFYELHDERVAGKYDAAARIRAALEGGEQ